MNHLSLAISLANKVHATQLDKAGQPYILHPLRLMLKFDSEDERIVAVLHDVVEDSDTTLSDLIDMGFSSAIVSAIDCLTKKTNEDYEEFIGRVSLNPLATKIKIEDIKHNLDLSRIHQIQDKDLVRVKKYHIALKFLLTKIDTRKV